MKRTFLLVILLGLILFLLPMNAAGESDPPAAPEPYAGKLLCAPDAYPQQALDCLPLGPSEFLTDLARQGIAYPFKPLSLIRIDDKYNELNVNYAKINVPAEENPPIYASVDEAMNGGSPIATMKAGALRYVAYNNRMDIDGAHYVLRNSGGWMRGSPLDIPKFQGFVFNSNPKESFGWIVEEAHPRVSASTLAAETGEMLPRETVVPIYDVVEAEETKWYMIGMGQWLERRYIRQFKANPTPPEGVDNGRWIEVNLYEQTLAVYDNNTLVFATLVATGMDPFFTRPGLFKIERKLDLETMSGAFEADGSDYYYLEDVPWTMYFDEARALHGAYWRTWFGFEQSHGCVNLSVADARWIYEWAHEGDYVYVWDPSGKTPTDPAFYTEGGA
jgi:hypothetical protein